MASEDWPETSNPATDGGQASLNLVPVPSPDKWGGLVSGRASDHKTFARTNMASEDCPETSTPHNVGKDVEEEKEVR